VNPGGGIEVRLFKLSATYPLESVRRDAPGGGGEPARPKGSRPCCWTSAEPADTPVFDRAALPPGQLVTGPALIEDVDTVIAVSPGWTYLVGDDLSGTLRRVE
jgi:N-methylhydantoinase A/oxoprolinase/acetone carboxylase beta subunit